MQFTMYFRVSNKCNACQVHTQVCIHSSRDRLNCVRLLHFWRARVHLECPIWAYHQHRVKSKNMVNITQNYKIPYLDPHTKYCHSILNHTESFLIDNTSYLTSWTSSLYMCYLSVHPTVTGSHLLYLTCSIKILLPIYDGLRGFCSPYMMDWEGSAPRISWIERVLLPVYHGLRGFCSPYIMDW